MTNGFSTLPSELVGKISDYCDSTTKRALLMVNCRLKSAVLGSVRSIRVFRSLIEDEKTPEDILIKVILRFPKLEKIIFGPPKNWWNKEGAFKDQDAVYLNSLMAHFQCDYFSLRRIKKIVFFEIKGSKELNALFLSTLVHENLENIRIRNSRIDSVLHGSEIQPVIDNSPYLKTFVLDPCNVYKEVELSFLKKFFLTKVKLLTWVGSPSTIRSLGNCRRLKTLTLDTMHNLKSVLLEDHQWDLHHLKLKGETQIDTDDELDKLTRNFPNLESLSLNLFNVSNTGMQKLGQNCSKLKILEFVNHHLTDSGLDQLTRLLPQIEIFNFGDHQNITEIGIAALAQNCSNLKAFRIAFYKSLDRTAINALINSCPHLKVVSFVCGPLNLDDMYHLVKMSQKIRFVEILHTRIDYYKLGSFYDKSPQIKKIPSGISSLKKLLKL